MLPKATAFLAAFAVVALLLLPPVAPVASQRQGNAAGLHGDEFDPNRHASGAVVKLVGGQQPAIDHANVAAAAGQNKTVHVAPGKSITGTHTLLNIHKVSQADTAALRKAFQERITHARNETKPLQPMPMLVRPTTNQKRKGIVRMKPGVVPNELLTDQITIVKFLVEGANTYQKRIHDVFVDLEEEFGSRALFVEINAAREKDFGRMTKYTYHGTPSLVAMRKGVVQDIIGPITESKVDKLRWFVQSAVLASEKKIITTVDSVDDARAFTDELSNRPIVVGIFTKYRAFRDAFGRSAVALHNDAAIRCLFLEVKTDDQLAAAVFPAKIREADERGAFLYVKYPEDNGSHAVVHFSPSFENPIEMPAFIMTHTASLVTELTKSNARYFGTAHPILALVQSEPTDPSRFRVLRHLAADFRGHFDFSFTGFDQSKLFANLPEMKRGNKAGFVIVGFEDGKFQKHVYSGEMKFNDVKQWVEFYLEGSLSKEKVPLNPVKNVDSITGKTFHTSLHSIVADQWISNVMDGSKDVVVYQYTSKCAPCQHFEVVVNNVANYLSHVTSLKLVKIDLDHETPPGKNRATHVPSLSLYPANRKENPVTYLGVGSKPRLLQWIKQYAAIRFKARNRDGEVFYARLLVFVLGWFFVIGFAMRKMRKHNHLIRQVVQGHPGKRKP